MYIHIYSILYTYEKKSLQVKGVCQKLKNSAIEEEIQSIHKKVLQKMHKYVKKYSQTETIRKKQVWSSAKFSRTFIQAYLNNVAVSLEGPEIVKSI